MSLGPHAMVDRRIIAGSRMAESERWGRDHRGLSAAETLAGAGAARIG